MEKNKLFIIIIFFIVTNIGVNYVFYSHIKKQDLTITTLKAEFYSHLEKEKASIFDQSIFSDDGYNYLAIGNSITKHPLNEYWWNEIGMAASTEDKDFVHCVARKLKKNKINVFAVNYSIWEMMAHDRAETYNVLDMYLAKKIDLITIQLGENVSDDTTLEKDYEELILHIKEICPQSKIILVGEFWRDDTKDSAKRLVADKYSIDFVDLSEAHDNLLY